MLYIPAKGFCLSPGWPTVLVFQGQWVFVNVGLFAVIKPEEPGKVGYADCLTCLSLASLCSQCWRVGCSWPPHQCAQQQIWWAHTFYAPNIHRTKFEPWAIIPEPGSSLGEINGQQKASKQGGGKCRGFRQDWRLGRPGVRWGWWGLLCFHWSADRPQGLGVSFRGVDLAFSLALLQVTAGPCPRRAQIEQVASGATRLKLPTQTERLLCHWQPQFPSVAHAGASGPGNHSGCAPSSSCSNWAFKYRG